MTDKGNASRDSVIIRTSAAGIAVNLLLAGFKAFVGFMSGSIAIELDAVNNLSDALSSVITITGMKLAVKKPDKKHPLGYGRYEYLSAAVISAVVLYAGITSLTESVKKVLNPEKADYTAPVLIVVAAAVAVKIILGLWVKRTGIRVNSDSLKNSGTDALNDAVVSVSTLAAALIYIIWGISLEAWLGIIIAGIIIKSGIEMLMETVDNILGRRIDSKLSSDIKNTVCSHEEVLGAYDLLLHSYGPEYMLGSIHIEVPSELTAHSIDELTRKIQKEIYDKNNVIITTVGIYSVNTDDSEAAGISGDIRHIIMSHDYLLQTHGIFVDMEDMRITFDVIIDFAAPDRNAVYDHLLGEIRERYPDFDVHITLDADVSD